MGYVEEHYENYDEDSRLISPHGQVEYITTMKYIHDYLKPGDKVLEVGCATGRYSLALANEGYPVTAVDLSEHNLSVLRDKLHGDEPVEVIQGNAMDLGFLSDNTYDVTLILGPLYHLYTREDMLKALNEAVRVTKTGGYIFVAYCMNEAPIVQYGFMYPKAPLRIFKLSIEKGWRARTAPEEIFTLMRTEDIMSLNEELPAKRIKFVATDGFTEYFRVRVDEMSEEIFNEWVDFHMSICERQDIIGVSNHTLDILQK